MTRNPLIRFCLPALAILLAQTLALSAGEPDKSFAGLDRIVAQIAELFPPVEGVVVSVEKDEIILDLKETDPIKPGDKLNLIRFGEELLHPTTKQKIGKKETELGQVRIIRVSKNFSIAHGIGALAKAQVGDGVRLAFQKVGFLVAPIKAVASEKIDTGQVALELEKRLKANPRFEVPPFGLGPWMLENKVTTKALGQPETLERLRQKTKADFIIIPEVRVVQNQSVMSYELVSVQGDKAVIKNEVLTERMPIVTDFGGKSPIQNYTKQAGNDAVQFLTSQDFEFEIVDFDIGDINGDGQKEYVVIDAYRVMIYKFENNLFKMVAMWKGKKGIDSFINVDVGDINHNGKDEIFVTSQRGESLSSFALEASPKHKQLDLVWESNNLYLRMIRPPDSKEPILLSQNPGHDHPFTDGIQIIQYQDGKYRETGKLPLPPVYGTQHLLYGLTQADLSKKETGRETIILDKDYHLRVYSPSGRLLEKSEDYYGHDPRYVTVGIKADILGMPAQQAQQQKNKGPQNFRGRLQFTAFDRDAYLLVPKNHTLGGGIVQKMVIINDSSLAILRVTKEGFGKFVETNRHPGYIAAYQVMDSADPQEKKIHIATVQSGELSLGKSTSSISTYIWKNTQ
jgi:hypothetical protein